jgi:hypothetical protein
MALLQNPVVSSYVSAIISARFSCRIPYRNSCSLAVISNSSFIFSSLESVLKPIQLLTPHPIAPLTAVLVAIGVIQSKGIVITPLRAIFDLFRLSRLQETDDKCNYQRREEIAAKCSDRRKPWAQVVRQRFQGLCKTKRRTKPKVFSDLLLVNYWYINPAGACRSKPVSSHF